MRRKICLFVFLFLCAAALTISGKTPPVLAQSGAPVPYTSYEFNKVDIYTHEFLLYNFSGMTPGDTFSVALERLNSDGSYNSTIRIKSVEADAMGDDSVVWIEGHEGWPTGINEAFPMRVMDSYGNVLGYHFLAPQPHTDWIQPATQADKLCIAGCVYNEETAAGNHHNPALNIGEEGTSPACEALPFCEYLGNAAKVITTAGDYVLVHYRYDTASPVAGDKIQIKDIDSGDLIFEAYISELSAYNTGTAAVSTGTEYFPLSTSGQKLPFIDENQEAIAAFSLDNPFEMEFPVAGYSYGRVDGGMADAVIREGMSVWGVTNDSTLHNWSVDVANSSIEVDGQQRAFRRAYDEDLYNAFPTMDLTDSAAGLIDGENHAYDDFRQTFFVVDSSPGSAELEWNLYADDLWFGQDVSDFGFTAVTNYTITAAAAIQSNQSHLQEAAKDAGLDTDVGSLVLLLLLTIAMCYLFYIMKARKFEFYAFGYVSIGSILYLMDLTTTFSNTIIGLSSLIVLLAAFVVNRSSRTATT